MQAPTFSSTTRRPHTTWPVRRGAKLLASSSLALVLLASLLAADGHQLASGPPRQHQADLFPGVARDLASFCSARPSLSVDLAPMLVHVKRNTSFNYKLYLFSNDEHVFQTGQIVPRDDFRIHSFPVKLKPLGEFFAPGRLQVFRQQQDPSGSGRIKLKRVPSSQFDAKKFFSLVALEPSERDRSRAGQRRPPEGQDPAQDKRRPRASQRRRTLAFDVHAGDALPGDESFAHHDVASLPDVAAAAEHANAHIEFDRDDQLAPLSQPKLRELSRRSDSAPVDTKRHQVASELQSLIMPVGSFSSFNLNVTFLVRKDFDQEQAELVRVRVEPQTFQVARVDLLLPRAAATSQAQSKPAGPIERAAEDEAANEDPVAAEDFAFLGHKLLRDPNTRVTAISQIYESWITRNFYTLVYVQRRPEPEEAAGELPLDEIALDAEDRQARGQTGPRDLPGLATERLIFRGSSQVLLGADQLDYHVKASAFITEKNGLHYYLEFLTNGKFYLGAIDWTKRPFKFIDSQRFPIKPTRTQFDNEELILCPPSICYSDQPIDELVSYGRLQLPDKLQREARILSKSSFVSATADASGQRALAPLPAHRQQRPQDLTVEEDAELALTSRPQPSALLGSHTRVNRQTDPDTSSASATMDANTTIVGRQGESISLDNLIEAVRLGAGRLDARLHLRDWVWPVPRSAAAVAVAGRAPNSTGTTFAWHYEWARRNEMKVTRDTYGFALVGHEIDAAYRVFNELYLISADQLITINYTLPTETVTSVHPLGDEFVGLGSTLLDPITGAFYDRYSNQVYFFKGDRYVGYDHATKSPLEDFLLPPAVDSLVGSILQTPTGSATPLGANNGKPRALVSSLPVVGILGRQHHVEAIWHDLHEDLVYVFSGMQFYSYAASDFKDGAFRAPTRRPPMRCINSHFLSGCRFDSAYPNPCKSDEGPEEVGHGGQRTASGRAAAQRQQQAAGARAAQTKGAKAAGHRLLEKTASNFSEEQQMRLRSIAARGGGLADFLLENSLIAQGATRAIEPFLSPAPERSANFGPDSQERIVAYLLISMVLISVLATVAMIVVIVDWAKVRSVQCRPAGSHPSPGGEGRARDQDPVESSRPRAGSVSHCLKQAQMLQERTAYPPAISQYLSKQYQPQASGRPNFFSGRASQPPRHPPQTHLYQAPQMAAPSSQLAPKPAARIPFRSYVTNGGQAVGPLERDYSAVVDSSAL